VTVLQQHPNPLPLSGQFLARTRAIFCSPGNFLPEESCPKELPERVAKAAKGQSSRANTKAAKRGNSCIT
ncbi:hypothetical protein, partial [Shewanella algae]|uniref:hypothetical protein n=1 Tax=Shewanella algae TaxID=38313 RepID=UPI001AADBD22